MTAKDLSRLYSIGFKRQKTLEYLHLKEEAVRAISLLPKKEMQDIMRLHYIDHYSWVAVSLRVHYSVDNCYKLRRAAVEYIEKSDL